MQLEIRARRVHVAPRLGRYIEGRLYFVRSRFGPRETGSGLYGPRLEADRRKLEIKSWVRLHHLELMKSCGRSVARSIGRSKATGPHALHLVTEYS
ncbi:MAG TPA: hypothetical protein VGK93_05115 [Candidatus Eisenbacteria bacterium]|jgi:hypothetical protein